MVIPNEYLSALREKKVPVPIVDSSQKNVSWPSEVMIYHKAPWNNYTHIGDFLKILGEAASVQVIKRRKLSGKQAFYRISLWGLEF